jgi:histidinol-phosphatase
VDAASRDDDLALALELADAAAAVTMAAFGGRHFVDLKSDATPVTEIDHAAERAIRRLLAARRPGDGVLGEEFGLDPGTTGRVWVVDPIDGTKMFAEGIPLWSTLIALRERDDVVVSVADAPALGERFHAVVGGGAWFGDVQVEVSTVPTLDASLVVHAALEEFAKDTGTGVESLLRLAAATRHTRGIADGWAHLLVARGAAEALVEQGPCFEWDWAATGLIVREAGGRLTRLEGGPPAPGCHLMVSNGLVDDELRQVLGLPGEPG